MSNASAREQLLLELINRARLDPKAEAKRFGISLNDSLTPGTLNAKAKQPLAMNDLLLKAADGHSDWMLDKDLFQHEPGRGGSDPGDRITDEGYTLGPGSTWGENISWNGTSGNVNATQAIFTHHEGLFKSSGHRRNMLNDDFQEAGIGQKLGKFTSPTTGTTWNASMTTEKFASDGSGDIFITGVFYRDKDGDEFYDVGEGQTGTVRAAGDSDRSGDAGGYALAIDPKKSQTVKLKAGGKEAVVKVDAQENVKLDFVDGKEVYSSADTELVSGAKTAKLLGVANLDLDGSSSAEKLTGNKGNNDITGGGGKDRLFGKSGNDDLSGQKGNDVLKGGSGKDTLNGGSGNDK
ncbi:MAG: CAP domain-containing protein, partial [Pseudomonadota bacterium]